MRQADAGGGLGLVFVARPFRRNAVLVALEVDDAVLLLVSAADESGGDPAAAVAAAGLRLPLRQRLLRTRLRDLIEGVMRLEPDSRSRRFVFVYWHSVPSFSPSPGLHAT